MKEHPTPFKPQMVVSILQNVKRQTLRMIDPQPFWSTDYLPNGWEFCPFKHMGQGGLSKWPDENAFAEALVRFSPYAVGDILWVRENCIGEELESGLDGVRYPADDAFIPIANTREAADDWLQLHTYRGHQGPRVGPTVPSIHMPRWACRILLEVTAVRAHRLQNITEQQAAAEGAYTCPATPAYDAFRVLWKTIYGAESWHLNPWVWAIEFRRVPA